MVYPLISTPYQASANVTSFTITLPAAIANGDGLVLFIGYSGGTTTVSSITGLTGLTQVGTRATVSGHSSLVYKKVNLSTSDSSTVLTVTLSAAARVTACALVLNAVNTTDFIDAQNSTVTAANSTTNTTPSVNTVGAGCYELSLVCTTAGANPQVTTFTAPGSISKDTTGLTSGGGTNPTAISIGHDFTSKSAASAIGSRAWTTDSSGSRSAWTLSIKPQNVAPTASAGSPQTVAKSTLVTLSGSASDTEGALVSNVWSPVGSTANTRTLSSTTILGPTYTPSTAGRDSWLLTATDDVGATGTGSVLIKVTDTTALPDSEISNAGSWTVTGAASSVAATSDSSDTSYISTPSGPSAATTELRLTPMPTPADMSGVKIHVRMRHVNATSNSQSVKLIQGTTVIQSWTQAVTSGWVTYEFAVGSTEAGTVTDWTDLRVRIAATAS